LANPSGNSDAAPEPKANPRPYSGSGIAEPERPQAGDTPPPGSEPHETTAHDAAAEIADGKRSATYRDVFRGREYRYLFSAIVLSLLGDQLAKVALSILVFQKTSSPLLTALSYGISYLPWVLGGPVLATFADRLPRRRVMIFCDIARAVLIGVLAIPGVPVSALLVLLLLASMFTPPFESARSALTTQILTGDVYVVGNGLAGTATQICNVIGLFAGGALVTVIHPRGALIADAATFLLSAGLIVFGVIERAVASRPASSTWQEISAGARVVFGTPTLRSIVLIVWISSVCSFAWEGIAVPWAHELGGGARTVGLLLGVSAAGTTVGSVIIGRVCPPRLRRRLILPLAVLAPALLGLVLADNAVPLDVLVLIFSGFGMAFVIPLNALFMQALPAELRGRAFGVAQGGLQATQGVGVLAAGALVGAFSITTTIGVLGLIGAAATLAIGLLQPIKAN
jgi:MFS family permease